jgi:hypothetical protein
MLCCGREVESRQGAGRAGSAGSGAVRCGAVRVGVWRRLACCGAACVPWVGLGCTSGLLGPYEALALALALAVGCDAGRGR